MKMMWMIISSKIYYLLCTRHSTEKFHFLYYLIHKTHILTLWGSFYYDLCFIEKETQICWDPTWPPGLKPLNFLSSLVPISCLISAKCWQNRENSDWKHETEKAIAWGWANSPSEGQKKVSIPVQRAEESFGFSIC